MSVIQDYLRYNRQMMLPEIGDAGQEKLKKAKVLVIGAGGLGCPILQYIATAGVGTIGIIDFDKI
uniref:THIF-type NAD/FAD binding fold domain-containing protein n=1 Tax=Hucho hucho TaxID=62062 RepID=A0A4W5KWN6_9TELE